MEYSVLGRTGRRVSRLGFGGAPAGLKNYIQGYDPEKSEDRESIVAAIRRAVELGVTYFDTAAGYGNGASERIFGEGLSGVAAGRIFLATKIGLWGGVDVRKGLEGSLKNLQREWVDLLQFHGTFYSDEQVEQILRPGGYLEQLERLRDEGLVRHIGFTVEAMSSGTYTLLRSGRFDVVQSLYNLMFQHPADLGWKCGMFYEAEAMKMGIVTMRSATSGMFQRWLQQVNPANTFDYTASLIQFVLSNPMVDVALVGMRSPQQVEENVRIVEDTSGRIDLATWFNRYV